MHYLFLDNHSRVCVCLRGKMYSTLKADDKNQKSEGCKKECYIHSFLHPSLFLFLSSAFKVEYIFPLRHTHTLLWWRREGEKEGEVDLLKYQTKLPPYTLPPVLKPLGLDLERKNYLYKEIRQFCKPDSANLVAPKPWCILVKEFGVTL